MNFGPLQILILASGVIFLLLLWVVVVMRHLNYLRQGVFNQWEVVDERLRKRQNVLPLLIEVVQKYGENEALTAKLIEERMRAAKEYLPGMKKIEFEFDLSKRIDEILALGDANKELGRDTMFLELKKEISDVEKAVEERAKKYTEMVRYYNKHRNFIFVRPLASMLGFSVLDIFEFEV